ncbi:hypothetical protein WG66_011998 [Moniliophthora roreri]|nr:hypothetical protein WG66_011998 [Moniliophthora roreri]
MFTQYWWWNNKLLKDRTSNGRVKQRVWIWISKAILDITPLQKEGLLPRHFEDAGSLKGYHGTSPLSQSII